MGQTFCGVAANEFEKTHGRMPKTPAESPCMKEKCRFWDNGSCFVAAEITDSDLEGDEDGE